MAAVSRPTNYSVEEIKSAAHYQKKALVWFALRFIVTGFLVLAVSFIARNTASASGGAEVQPPAFFQWVNYGIQAVYWIFSACMFYALYHLSRTLRFFAQDWLGWIVILACFLVGLLGVLFLLYAIVQSNRVFKAHGIKIGLMGPHSASVDEFVARSGQTAPLTAQ